MTLTFGGDARVRAQGYWPDNFGIGSGNDGYTLFRGLAHGDVRVGKHIQMFVQFGAYDEISRSGGPVSTDQSLPDLQQGFLAWNGEKLSLRAGRQEMTLGTSRLIAARDSPNIRRAFDGVRAIWKQESTRVDVFAFRPVLNKSGAFDDTWDKSESLLGVYATLAPARLAPFKADLYWFGYKRDEAIFAAAEGRESRHSFGTRLFGSIKGWDWNAEAVLQTGHIGDRSIFAWTIASDTGFTFDGVPWSPRLGLKANIASGDGNPADGKLRTFNLLYPNTTYFSEASLLSPANIMDLQPTLTLRPVRGLTFVLSWNFLWKHQKEDAVYTSSPPVIPETIGTGRYIGDQIKLEGSYRLNPQWEVRAAAVHFRVGSALTQAGGTDVSFLMTSLAFRW
ncbi:alginate export family protein [Nitrosomonas sp. HPC101]|uniref:alginate export family protein n=1 Tax=Nitrosomonas sp. HPC101 TaxID=1658667 RepID=UPI00136A2F8D